MKTITPLLSGRWLLLVCLLLTTSCELFEYHPYDTDAFDQTGVNQSNIEEIEAQDDLSDTLRFAFMGDTQRFYDETEDFVNDLNNRDDVDFVIHGGDITDFGLSKEYKWIYDIMKNLNVPFVSLIGNHDVIGHGKNVYNEIYGDFNFTFISHRTRFICLNTNALEFNYSTPVPDFDYMLGFVNDSADIDQTIVVMHAAPYDEQFNNNAVLMFNYIVEQYKNVRFCLHAHQHKLNESDFFDNGIMYYGCDDMESRSYLLFTVTPDSYNFTVEYY
ncbi:metallophosphoesterase family protein [Mangrovibacterium lignilyticum]|uniref:metallophosphoesterase family protein n=1 Tax=Mangrovibacterium lignilyticum TaxID=2668052 RepID=UPI0013D64758|nr:metallophosphoesterase [Mangrovibacterium lignilyticum]